MAFTKEQEMYFNEMIDILHTSNALNNVILVGSWAEYIYEKENILKDFTSYAKTTDIDFLLNDDNKATKPQNIVAHAKERGFVYNEDFVMGTSKLRKKDFEVEFLISQKGDGSRPLPKSELGVNAQQLSHIGFIKDNFITVDYNGYNLNIPKPEAYVLQKMIINDQRKHKAEIDRHKISNILPYIDREVFDTIYNSLFTKEKKKVDNYIAQYCPYFKNNEQISDIVNKYIDIQNKTKALSVQMEDARSEFFKLPKEQRNGIPWNGEKLRPAIFEDMYLAQCKKEGREPLKEISDHFWKNCVEMNDYTPKFCVQAGIERS